LKDTAESFSIPLSAEVLLGVAYLTGAIEKGKTNYGSDLVFD
jgi:hypothetical protein